MQLQYLIWMADEVVGARDRLLLDIVKSFCTSMYLVLPQDLDGSLFGSLPGAAGGGSTLVGVSPIAGAGRPTYAQGTPVADGPCPFLDDAVSTPGYICVPGWTKSAPGVAVSSQGVWGDPQLLVIESRDKVRSHAASK